MKLLGVIEEQLLQNLRNKVQNVAQNVPQAQRNAALANLIAFLLSVASDLLTASVASAQLCPIGETKIEDSKLA